MAVVTENRTRRARRFSKQQWQETLTAYAFLAPATITLIIFGIYPLFYAFYMSLYNWRIVRGSFAGWGNYVEALGTPMFVLMAVAGILLAVIGWFLWDEAGEQGRRNVLPFRVGAATLAIIGIGLLWVAFPVMLETGDDDFFNSIIVTIWYSIGTVPVQIVLSLLLATILYQKIRGKAIYRMLFFLPYITPAVAAAAIFRVMFIRDDNGVINRFIGLFGVEPQRWLQERTPALELILGRDLPALIEGPSLALMVIIIFNIWTFVGFNTVVYLAGLGQISKDLYEAADVDGADRWQSFRNITIPLLSPTTFFLSMLGIIGTFKAFNHVYVMQVTGSRGATTTSAIFIFNEFYQSNKAGYAAALAFILFLIILLLTIIQNRIMGRRVFYD